MRGAMSQRTLWRLNVLSIAIAVFLSTVASTLGAGTVRIFEMQTQEAFLEGKFEGVGVDRLGTLRLADRVEKVAPVEEPFVFAAASHPEGAVLGTGNSGRVVLARRDGTAQVLFSLPEPEVFAVHVDDDGSVLAGSSPNGKVYRLAPGATDPEAIFDPGERYIWDLERDAHGHLLVATGTEGRLLRVAEDGTGEVVLDHTDPHIRTLAVAPRGEILIGTAGNGLVLLLDRAGKLSTLYDAAQPEVTAFAFAPDGDIYVAALASEASFLTLGSGAAKSNGKDESEEKGEDGKVSVTEGAVSAGSRPASFEGARSLVLRIAPGLVARNVTSWKDETVHSLLYERGRLWIGTGLEGKLYSWQAGQRLLERDFEERQVIALLAPRSAADGPGPIVATTNGAAVYRFSEASEREGRYTSQALDAEQPSRFGTLHWRGRVPAGATLEWQVRSGMSAKPDATWSEWQGVAARSDREREVSLGDVPRGRYLQWRAALRGARGVSPRIDSVEISYLQANQAPLVSSVEVLDPGEILVPQGFNPTSQVFEPATPNKDGIFTTIDPGKKEPAKRTKTLWKKGFRTLRWKAEDPNSDELRFALAFRPEGEASGESEWLEIAEDLETSYWSFDSTALPDGLYRFQVTASDRRGNPEDEALEGERTSALVTVDNSPPELEEATRRGDGIEATVVDRLSPLRRVEVSVDAEVWTEVPAADGLLDGRRESFSIDAPPGALVLLRVTDAALNVVTLDLTSH